MRAKPGTDLWKRQRILDKEQAVIEAAEALVADLGMLEGCEVPFPLHKLIHAQREAVLALQEARDGY